MKRQVVLLLILPFILHEGSAQQNHYKIIIRWTNNPGIKKLTLWYLQPEHKSSNRDTAIINKDGSFIFEGAVDEPVAAIVRVATENKTDPPARMASLNFYLENSVINIEIADQLTDAKITGSKTNVDFVKLKTRTSELNKKMEAIAMEATNLQQNNNLTESKEKELIGKNILIANEKEEILTDFIQDNPGSYVSVFALREFAGPFMKPVKVEPVFNLLSPEIRSSIAAKQFADLIKSTKQVQVGLNAPAIQWSDINGNSFNLSLLKGKYVLVDFWASWCVPCRRMNPELVKIYNIYKSKNFEIVGVSFDVNKTNWADAVKKDKLEWIHISELTVMEHSSIAKKYGVVAVPQNFLLDREGKIISMNITADKLEALLNQSL